MIQPEAAREAARRTDGKFGTQPLAEADIDLVGSLPADMPASEQLQDYARQVAAQLPGGWSFDKMADPPAGAVVISDVDQVGELTLEETEDGKIEAEFRTDDFHEHWAVEPTEDGLREVSAHTASFMARQWKIIDRDAAEDEGDDEMDPSDAASGAGDEDAHLYTAPAETPEPTGYPSALDSVPESYRAAAAVTYSETEAMRAALTLESDTDWSLVGFEPGGRRAIYGVSPTDGEHSVRVRITPDSRGWHVDVEDEGDETDGWDDHFTGEEVEALSDQLNSSIFREVEDDDRDDED